jgi:hypothetical protein
MQVDTNFLCRLDIVIWRVHNLIGDAVAVSIIGFVLGEHYCMM